jgi:hypothetical protein
MRAATAAFRTNLLCVPFLALFTEAWRSLPDSYLEVLSCYEAQAQKFAEKEKRPAVLVIDAIEDLEQTLQVEMIRRAKVSSLISRMHDSAPSDPLS